ncbi:MAG: acyl-CoA dehydrogenase [OM182 bacterium MED-G24]|uniref:Acyl-CoA dehydrogenase n=1 Tax=OM182 bacterium MED-G24 TaxID=1986255 RepID=A0A2A5WSZ3_9GAMM|nr:MAG: acyl-CoA dehydrogenase [OM182 bacterium MED-G24]|tara:strand:+ start:2407 stop:3468 length:1062 start_codon:yes stop_codon:yes gene_type:complete
MRFGLSEEQTLLADSVTRFLADNVPLDEVRKVASGESSDAAVWQGLTELGVPGLLIPEDHGGVGLGSLDAVVVADCLGANVTPSPFLSSAVIAPTVLVAAGQREDLLGSLAGGEIRIGTAFGEAIGARVDADVKVSGGKLSGKSLFALDTHADHFLVATKGKHVYLVNASDCEVTDLPTVDRTRTTCEIKYNNVAAELISDNPDVFTEALDRARVVMAADTLGAAQHMIDEAVAYAKVREQFNRPIATFQAVKHMCAQMTADLEPCRSMVWYAGHALDNVPEEARLLACHTKAHLAEVGRSVSKTATEVHGGMGFTDLLGLHYWFKRCGFNRQMLGVPELVREEAARIQGLAA